jgi:hypothetical protein
VLNKFNQPFPDKSDLKKSLLTILYVGVGIGVFLFLLRPFGIDGTWANLSLACAGFGGVTVVFGWFFELGTRFVFNIETDGPSWTLGKWVLMSIALIVWIAIGNYLFVNWLYGWSALGYFNLIRMIGYTAVIGVFPVVLSGIVVQLKAAQRNEQSAEDIEGHLKPAEKISVNELVLRTENGQNLSLKPANISYVEAMQNYVTVWFLRDNVLTKETLRTTISNMEEQLQSTAVVRCHRSFLINVNAIEHVSGNAQGLRLQLVMVSGVEVPVSRSYIPKLRALLD